MNITSRIISPPLTPSAPVQQHGLLPSFVQQQETAQVLRPMVALQQQHVHGQPQWLVRLRQVAGRRATAVFYTLLALVLVYFVAAGGGRRSTAAPTLQQHEQIEWPDSTEFSSQSTFVAAAVQQAQGVASDPTAQTAHTNDQSSSSSSSSSSSISSRSTNSMSAHCPYGSLPGTWVSAAPAGSKWQVLDTDCQLRNWLAAYAAVASHSRSPAGDAAGSLSSQQPAGSSSSNPVTSSSQGSPSDDNSSSSSDGISSSTSTSDSSTIEAQLPKIHILLLSDSVDRFIVQHVCDYLGGMKRTVRMKQHLASLVAGYGTGAAHSTTETIHIGQQQQRDGQTADSSTAAAAGDAAALSSSTTSPEGSAAASSAPASRLPSNLNATAYAFHTCEFGPHVPLKLASSYFPGVHPTGPFHRGLNQNYAARIDAATTMWGEYAGEGQPPHVVSVASALWDMARLWMHERGQLEGREELSRQLLDSWMANFTTVVQHAKEKLPQTELWLAHTTMMPAHDVNTGWMTKPYLGRRYFIEQLNAAAKTAARRLGLQLVDYAAVSSRFMEGQQHLTDLIHPNAEVALEVFNLLLNLAIAQRGL